MVRFIHGGDNPDVFAALAFGLIVSAVCSVGVVLFTRNCRGFRPHGHEGPQKIHEMETPRIGGVAIITGVLVAVVLLWPRANSVFINLLCVLPIAFLGTVEDLTNRVSALARLLVSVLSAILLVYVAETLISQTGFKPFDWLLALPGLAALFTLLAITAKCHAINIIDGLNGLASGTCILVLGTISCLAGIYENWSLSLATLVVMLPTVGFFFINFPKGLIFLGDGGSYFLGMIVAVLAINLPTAVPEVSSFASLLMVSYPIYETIRSYVRRFRNPGQGLMQPDDKHLHSRLFKLLNSRLSWSKFAKNATASLVVLIFPASGCLVVFMFHGVVEVLVLGLCLKILCYELLMHLVEKQIYIRH